MGFTPCVALRVQYEVCGHKCARGGDTCFIIVFVEPMARFFSYEIGRN